MVKIKEAKMSLLTKHLVVASFGDENSSYYSSFFKEKANQGHNIVFTLQGLSVHK